MKNHGIPKPFKLLPYEVIAAACSGDVNAIELVLKHYDAYITRLSKRYRKEKYGILTRYFDPDRKASLQEKLIKEIPNWKELI